MIFETVFLPVAGWQQKYFTVRVGEIKFQIGVFWRNIELFVSVMFVGTGSGSEFMLFGRIG
ncbi:MULTISPECIES: hypothetical protein [Gluconobacter]|uniref:Uncharacterized protein n=1 Tax=Gluconobacter cadivus TaxID=2728101 RepID=A0ABR9YT93_9PROT|nr:MULTISPECIES: hypothetical protein [Gluconobacter]MBF0887122.1 hypothetical protein [Gluconobacter cadivus]MBS1059191.1 hypothetical protein [Gluconobacter sp. Dm-44]